MPKLDTIEFSLTVDGNVYTSQFSVNREVGKEDTTAIGVVMQKWITQSLNKILETTPQHLPNGSKRPPDVAS